MKNIREIQPELFPEEIKKGKNTKAIIVRQSSSTNFRGWNDVVASMAKNFSISDRKYFAGMTDGDGSFHIPTKYPNKIRIGIELRHDHAEPISRLAEIFDLTISKKIYLIPKGNTKPTLKIELAGIKSKVFLFSIYPYLLEKKDEARKVLLALDCEEKYLPKEKQFSFEYLAGYTDAEGTVNFSLRHQKNKTGSIISSYQQYYLLTSNNSGHLQFIKKNLIDLGFDHFRKDFIRTYKNVKKRKGTNPEKWKNTSVVSLGGTPTQLSKFYKNVEPFILIKHKKENMQHTITYNRVITSNERFKEMKAK
tara:strand:+ start:40 stop:960 length:921 start_codon:yes stop_codon:yes gene_type:complete